MFDPQIYLFVVTAVSFYQNVLQSLRRARERARKVDSSVRCRECLRNRSSGDAVKPGQISLKVAAWVSAGIRTQFFHIMLKLMKFYLSYLGIKVTNVCSYQQLHSTPLLFQLTEMLIKAARGVQTEPLSI